MYWKSCNNLTTGYLCSISTTAKPCPPCYWNSCYNSWNPWLPQTMINRLCESGIRMRQPYQDLVCIHMHAWNGVKHIINSATDNGVKYCLVTSHDSCCSIQMDSRHNGDFCVKKVERFMRGFVMVWGVGSGKKTDLVLIEDNLNSPKYFN